MDIKSYLERLHYHGGLDPNLENLTMLQQAHLMSVPFENLDIHHKIKIDLSNTYQKIVTRKRGGFCYELNSLFYELLRSFGYEVKIVSARVYQDMKGYGPEFDHMAIVVKIKNDNYLVDVGFGEFAFYPLKIEMNSTINDPRGIFMMETYDEKYTVVKKKKLDGEFQPEYMFSEKERTLDEFREMCEFHQMSKESHFTQKRICSLPTSEGRITLTDNTLKITAKNGITEKQLANETEVQNILLKYFNIR